MGAVAGRRVKTYSDQEKQQAALVYSIEGRLSRTARKLGISHNTLQSWTTQDWWPAMLNSVRSQKNFEIDAGLTRILDKSVESVLTRLDKGDPFHYKGEVLYKPVSALSAATVAAIAYDKRALMRGDPTSRTERITTDKRLRTLHAEFRTASDAEVIAKIEPQ